MSDTVAPLAAEGADRSAAPVWTGLAAAGRAVPVALLAALPGLVFVAGFDHLAYGLGLLAGIVLAGLVVAPRVAGLGAATIPDALARRFGRTTALIAGVVLVLVVLPLLTAELALVGVVAEAAVGAPYLAAILVTLALAAAAALRFNDRALGRMAVAAYALLAIGLLVPLALMAFKTHGLVFPHIAYGEALPTVDNLEEQLVENGLVDFDTFGLHVTPFLRLTGLDLFALVIALALGTAVLPHLVSALATGARPAAARFAGAWTALFVMLILMTVPALAAYAKLAIYGAMTASTPLAALPAWLEAPLRADLAHIHGTSLAMLDQATKAVAAGATDPSALGDHIAAHALTMGERWNALDGQVRRAIIETARTLGAGASASAADIWQAYLAQVLPVAAAAAGNEAATLTQAALVIEPEGLLLALPGLSGAPVQGAILIAVSVLAMALVVATALIRALLSLGAGEQATGTSWRGPALAIGVAVAAAGIATLRPDDLVTVVVSALSLGAAGLFPVLALGLAWRRATAAGAMAAIVLGAGVTLYYDVGIQVFPTAFYRTWAPLSNAGEFAIEEFTALETEAREAEDDETKATAAAALEKLARGTATRAGLANWFGIDSASGAVFGVPLGLAVLVLVSLATRRRLRRVEET